MGVKKKTSVGVAVFNSWMMYNVQYIVQYTAERRASTVIKRPPVFAVVLLGPPHYSALFYAVFPLCRGQSLLFPADGRGGRGKSPTKDTEKKLYGPLPIYSL